MTFIAHFRCAVRRCRLFKHDQATGGAGNEARGPVASSTSRLASGSRSGWSNWSSAIRDRRASPLLLGDQAIWAYRRAIFSAALAVRLPSGSAAPQFARLPVNYRFLHCRDNGVRAGQRTWSVILILGLGIRLFIDKRLWHWPVRALALDRYCGVRMPATTSSPWR